MGGFPPPFAENSAKIINSIFEPFSKFVTTFVILIFSQPPTQPATKPPTYPSLAECFSSARLSAPATAD